MSVIRKMLLTVSALGTVLIGAAFVVSLLDSGYVEEIAKDIIRRQVEEKVHEKIEALDESFLSSRAGALVKKHAEEAETARQRIKEKAPERIAAVIAEMRDLDCECRRKIENTVRAGFELRIAAASRAQERLTSVIRTKYMETAEKLTREFRIFTGTNALIFALLGIAAFFKEGAGRHLVLPALVLIVAAAITGCLYLFNQNWLHTILFSDYVGLTYIVYLSIVFAFLCDVSFNRARVTARLLNSVGGKIQALPC
jgi:hypothetical protein